MTQYPAILKDNLRTISLIALIGASVITGLTLNAQAANVVSQELEKGSAEPEYFQVPSNHAAMRRAVTDARKTIGKFIAALKHPEPGQQDFEVKKPFIQGSQAEHIWLSDVRFVGGHFQGRVDNKSRNIQGPQLGQLVSVSPEEISDWLYVDNGALVGGKGILYLLEVIPFGLTIMSFLLSRSGSSTARRILNSESNNAGGTSITSWNKITGPSSAGSVPANVRVLSRQADATAHDHLQEFLTEASWCHSFCCAPGSVGPLRRSHFSVPYDCSPYLKALVTPQKEYWRSV